MTKRCILRGLAALVAGLMLGACGDDPIEPSNGNGGGNEPSHKETTREVAVTGGVYDLGTTCATLRGYANLNLLTGYTASEMRIGIQCDEDDGEELDKHDDHRAAGVTGNEFNVTIQNLHPNRAYQYRAFVYVNGIYHFGETKKFKTLGFTNFVTAGNVTSPGITFAEVKLTLDKGKIPTLEKEQERYKVGVAWATDRSALTTDKNGWLTGRKQEVSIKQIEQENGNLVISNLLPQTTYYYCAFTSCQGEYALGEVKSFTTKDFTQMATVGKARELGFNAAVVDVEADLKKRPVDYRDVSLCSAGLLFGLDKTELAGYDGNEKGNAWRRECFKSYDLSSNDGTVKQAVSLEGLRTDTTYYYCAYTCMKGVYKKGEVRTFSTMDLASIAQAAVKETGLTMANVEVKVDTTKMSAQSTDRRNYSAGLVYSTNRAEVENYNGNGAKSVSTFYGSNMQDGKTETSETATLKNLSPRTVYFYCAYTKINNSYKLGELKQFTTRGIEVIATCDAPTDISLFSAKVRVTADPSKFSPFAEEQGQCRAGFLYSFGYANIMDGYKLVETYHGNGGRTEETVHLQGLLSNMLYYYCTYTTFGGKMVISDVRTMTTSKIENIVVGCAITDIGTTTANVRLTVDPSKCSAVESERRQYKAGIEYSKSKIDMMSNPRGKRALIYDAGISPNATTQTFGLSDLEMDTEYYYRTITMVGSHPAYGELQSFRTNPYVPVYTGVDLGLPSGTIWATVNVGATDPWEYGDYFAWGEVEGQQQSGKRWYSWGTYKYCNGSETSITKYCCESQYGKVDNKRVLEPEDDAATVNWGEEWEMPTIEQFNELRQHTTSRMTYYGETLGAMVYGKNGNSIFFPLAGVYHNKLELAGEYTSYWCKTLAKGYSSSGDSMRLDFGNNGAGWHYDGNYRWEGISIRPVRKK